MSLFGSLRNLRVLVVLGLLVTTSFSLADTVGSVGENASEEELALREAGIEVQTARAVPALAGFEPVRDPGLESVPSFFRRWEYLGGRVTLFAVAASLLLFTLAAIVGAKLRARRWSHREYVQPEPFSIGEGTRAK